MVGIPTRASYRFAELENLANAVIGRLQIWYRASAKRNPRNIQEALMDFNDAVRDFVDSYAQMELPHSLSLLGWRPPSAK
jgi:hypothetical protein